MLITDDGKLLLDRPFGDGEDAVIALVNHAVRDSNPCEDKSLRGLLRSLIRFASLRSKNASHFAVSGFESAATMEKKHPPPNGGGCFLGTP